MAKDAIKAINIKPIKDGPFKYYQFEAIATTGFTGEVFLNGKSMFKINERGGNTSDNTAQDILKNGKNEILLKIDSVSNVGPLFFGEIIGIYIHGVNEQVAPSKSTRIVIIGWKPQGNKPETIKYVFELKK